MQLNYRDIGDHFDLMLFLGKVGQIQTAAGPMIRRDFISLLGNVAAWPFGRALAKGIPVVGFLGPTAPQAWASWTKAFVDRFAQLGWADGRTVAIVYRWADGHTDRFGDLAAELVALKVDLIVTAGSATRQTMKETSQIPIVFALASEPVATGMVASLSRPGGNVTGLSLESPDLAGKRLSMLRDVAPAARHLAVLADFRLCGLDPGSRPRQSRRAHARIRFSAR